MWNGKNKAVTFSFDDGVKQDVRAIEILNKYGLKSTFNLNSGNLGKKIACRNGVRSIVSPEEIKKIYAGHEVAVHTVNHPNLTEISEADIIYQVEEDRKALSKLCGYEVMGMAYPCGGVNNDERVAKVIKENTPIKYSRTITSTHNFDLQSHLLRFNPSVYYCDKDKLFELGERFIKLKTDKPQLLYIWGHTYEMDEDNRITWEDFEKFCEMISGKLDIYYGTNKEILLGN